ncbi:Uncharacterised protein [Mycobacterium tuberculosis]|uniref:hypothetical protein n=1 Tax=Mycobacterium tuberculosis TaxID=1773 RepID=UPI0005DD80EA|nr:hypothetical protein [Mycobacterium tuberculosis]CKO09621.1 Uncharacterised protein [Mycobacterium tuberculosis]CKO18716.1 Uncharacterised protein [Mycobacterium tuberculosis]CNL18265.1 Uncharacterised protein [Mycobacterium tuberculosis]CRH16904.1 hypothetical protein BN1303_03908 [Mycobacterium tuberculosis]
MAAGALVVGAFGGHIVWLSGRLGQRAGRTPPCDRRVDIATVHIGTALGCGLRPAAPGHQMHARRLPAIRDAARFDGPPQHVA